MRIRLIGNLLGGLFGGKKIFMPFSDRYAARVFVNAAGTTKFIRFSRDYRRLPMQGIMDGPFVAWFPAGVFQGPADEIATRLLGREFQFQTDRTTGKIWKNIDVVFEFSRADLEAFVTELSANGNGTRPDAASYLGN